MIKLFKKIWNKMNEPHNERVLMILLPCLAILVSGCILAPRLLYFAREAIIPDAASSDVEVQTVQEIAVTATPQPQTSQTPSPSPAASPEVSPTASPAASPKLVLSASSTERDLYVKVKDENGTVQTGKQFTLTFNYPSGESYSFKTETDGSCYLVKLEPGEYTVTMEEAEGYSIADPVSCQVKPRVEYVQIENIDEYLSVLDNTVLDQSEIKTGSDSGEVLKPEVIVTIPEASGTNNTVTEEIPVLDEQAFRQLISSEQPVD